jgi:hypothetical protein
LVHLVAETVEVATDKVTDDPLINYLGEPVIVLKYCDHLHDHQLFRVEILHRMGEAPCNREKFLA